MQKKKKKKGRVPRYSADGMMIRMIGGVLLAAGGALAAASAALKLTGVPFENVRMLAGGLGGTLSLVLAALVMWGGILLIIASQRAVSTRYFWPSCILLVLLCSAFTLMSRSANDPLMDYLSRRFGTDAYQDFIVRGWDMGIKQQAGGAIGMLIAWPLWSLLGSSLAASLLVVGLMILCLVLTLPIKWKALFGMIGKAKDNAAQAMAQRREQAAAQRAEEAEWQRQHPEQARQAYAMPNPAPQQVMPVQGGRRAVANDGDVQAAPVGSRVNTLSGQELPPAAGEDRPYRASIFGEREERPQEETRERRGIFSFGRRKPDNETPPREPVVHPGEGMRETVPSAEESPRTARPLTMEPPQVAAPV